MQSMLCDSLLVEIAKHEQRQSLTQFLFVSILVILKVLRTVLKQVHYLFPRSMRCAYVWSSLSMCSYGRTSGFDFGTLLHQQCFQNKTSAIASDGNFYICDAYFHSSKFPK